MILFNKFRFVILVEEKCLAVFVVFPWLIGMPISR